jgi:DNA primase small subunit
MLGAYSKMEEAQKSREFVKSMFAEYYRRPTILTTPTRIESREFGFVIFDERGMLRHVSFKSAGELKSFLEKSVPSDAYFSCAYYDQPTADMDRKGWLGADLVFDIDADHIPTPCGKVHDEWSCGGCGFVGKGLTPDRCPACGSEKFDVKIWPCNVCLDSAKAEAVKLLDMLSRDFGFSEKEIHAFFSGHRGYHVHVENEAIEKLDAVARREIVDYVGGLGLDTVFHGFDEEAMKTSSFLGNTSLNHMGWRERMFQGMHDFILNAKPEDYRNAGLTSNIIEAIMKNKDAILKNWDDARRWGVIKGVGFGTWKKIVELCLNSQSAKIDTAVTTDIHRLIRLTDSLHGKTGLRKIELPLSEINDFDPFKSAVAFKKGNALVFVSDSPEFRLGDETFGPYRNQKVELPAAAAVFLVCKGRAGVVDWNVQ